MASRTETGRVRTDPRISRRRKAVARTRRRRIAGSFLGLTLLGVGIWAAFWSPLLAVGRIQVAGARHTTAADVRAAADLGADDNLLLVSTGSVAAAVEELPWVADAEVHRKLPGTVRIKVEERKAALVVTIASGTWTIDEAGRVLEEGAVTDGMPTLTGAVLGALEPGEQIHADEVRAGLEVWASLTKKVRADVASVVAPARERIALALQDGTIVRYGGAEHLKAKNEVLGALLERLESEGRAATYIDISVPGSPAVGPAPSAATPGATTATPAPTPTV